MSVSHEKVELMRAIRRKQSAYKASRPHVLNDEQQEKLTKAFYKYAEQNGWYRKLGDAIKENGKYIWNWQHELIDEVLRSVFQKKGYTIAVSIKRQEGKTEIMALILVFCYQNYFKTFGDPFAVGIVGPGKVVSNNVFTRLRDYLLSQETELFIDKADYKESLSGDVLIAISISATGGTTIEGKTLNFLLRDESHEGSDKRWRDEVLWTTASIEGATTVYLGTAGYKNCDYKKLLQTPEDDRPKELKVHTITYDTLSPYMKELGEKGLRRAATWEERTMKLIRQNGGMNSPETRKNVFCEWQDGISNYIQKKHLESCTRHIEEFDSDGDDELYAFIDMGYSGDRSWATIMNQKKELIDLIMLKDANRMIALRDQLEYFFYIIGEKGYDNHIKVVGIDRTGLGIGAFEMIQEISPYEIHPIVFSLQQKHEMFTILRNHLTTEWVQDRITLPAGHEHIEMLYEEFLNLEQKPTENGLLKFHANQEQVGTAYDDICDSLAGCLATLLTRQTQFTGLTPQQKLMDKEMAFLRRKRQMQKQKPLALATEGMATDW